MKAAATVLAHVALAWAIPDSNRGLQGRAVDVAATNVISLQRVQGPAPLDSRLSTASQLIQSPAAEPDANTTKLEDTMFLDNVLYIATIYIGDERFEMKVDTGSSDSWLMAANYTCYVGGETVMQEFCGFGAPYKGQFQELPDVVRFGLRYGDGSAIAGKIGAQNVTIAGLTIKNQELAFIDEAAWAGDGVTSGTLGLAYPIVGRTFTNSDPSLTYPGSSTHRKYDTVFTSLYKQNLTAPVFSLAMNKTARTGWLAFGGLPPVEHSPEVARTPIRVVGVDGGAEVLLKELSYYTIVPDDWLFGSLNTSNFTYENPSWDALQEDVKPNQFPVIIDSGSAVSFLPEYIARNYARQIPGPVRLYNGNYWALCDAKLPPLGTVIGGKTLWWRDEDVMLQDNRQEFVPPNEQEPRLFCALGIMDIYTDGPYILGDNFLNAVVSVFDIGASEMRFYQRTG